MSVLWPDENHPLGCWAAACSLLIPGVFLCGFLFTILFAILVTLFVNSSAYGFADVVASIPMCALYAGTAGLLTAFTGLVSILLVSFVNWALKAQLKPDSFSSLSFSLAMIPVGYMAALSVGFSMNPDEQLLVTAFAGTILFGAVFGVVFSRKFETELYSTGDGSKFQFDLRAIFVLTALVSVALVIDQGSYLILFLFAVCAPVNAIVVFVFRVARKTSTIT